MTVEDYKEIRQRYLNGESQRSIARSLHISRNTVAKYCEGAATPWTRKSPERAPVVLTEDVTSFMRSCLETDAAENIRKQKHTAKRIYDRLVTECGFTGAESTVRHKVHELRDIIPKAFIPLAFSPGEAIQADWGDAFVYINKEREKINIFCARLCNSCAPVVLAFRRQNEESFLEAFVRAFAEYGGVTEKVIFDNARVAVKEGFGAHAKKQAGYTALSAHYGFDALFCNPAEGHEKGLVEGLVGWARRNILVPMPKVNNLEELNAMLMERCRSYGSHTIQGRSATVGEMLTEEKKALRPLPLYEFETAKCSDVRVSSFSTARFNTNDYSVPVEYAGRRVGVKGYAERVEIYCEGKLIASHERCFDKHEQKYKLEHYLPLLKERGRAILNAAPVRQNVPEEVLVQLRAAASDKAQMMGILQKFCDTPESKVPAITDVVCVQPVNLSQYDAIGKAVSVGA